MTKACGVIGYFLDFPMPPCEAEPTQTIRFQCERGHVKDRELCDVHAGVLLANGDLGAPLCRQCHDVGLGDIPIVPVAPPLDLTPEADDATILHAEARFEAGRDD